MTLSPKALEVIHEVGLELFTLIANAFEVECNDIDHLILRSHDGKEEAVPMTVGGWRMIRGMLPGDTLLVRMAAPQLPSGANPMRTTRSGGREAGDFKIHTMIFPNCISSHALSQELASIGPMVEATTPCPEKLLSC